MTPRATRSPVGPRPRGPDRPEVRRLVRRRPGSHPGRGRERETTKRDGNDVVVVVSAMGEATDDLIALASQVSGTRPGPEMDMLLTTGERISTALLTMALADLGVPAVSFTGSQVGIITDTVHGKAKIIEVKGDRVRQALADGKVAVVAGFQGVAPTREITTMGRGASDLTASALARRSTPTPARSTPT